MKAAMASPLVYRGVQIDVKVNQAGKRVFGHADLFANNEFKARLSVGSAKSRPEDLRDRLRCLAKSKVDVWAIAGSEAVH